LAAIETSEAAMNCEGEALEAVLSCRPTTLAGVAAVLEYLSLPEFLIEEEDERTGETTLSGRWECDSDAARKYPAILATALRQMLPPIVPSAGGSPDPDARLLKLIDQYSSVNAEHDKVDAKWQKAYEKQKKSTPMPEVLRVRPEDDALGIPNVYREHREADAIVGNPPKAEKYERATYDLKFLVDRLREPRWTRVKKIDPPEGTEFFYCGGAVAAEYFDPSPAARARADEIVQAYDEWYAKDAGSRAQQNRGARMERLCGRIFDIRQKIERTPARTFAGLVAKAKIVAELAEQDDESEHPLACSISRDVLAFEPAAVRERLSVAEAV